MNEIKVFENAQFGEVRMIMKDDEPWFVAADVCKVLEHSNVTVALERLDDDEKAKLSLGLPGGATGCVNEPGLYSLVLGSRKPEAQAFKRWVTHEVLPSIRRQGYYSLLTDEKLLEVIEERRREDNNYLADGMRQIQDKLTAERWAKMREVWDVRTEYDMSDLDNMIRSVWCGDELGCEKARRHFWKLCCEKYGLCDGTKWKEPYQGQRGRKRRSAEKLEDVRAMANKMQALSLSAGLAFGGANPYDELWREKIKTERLSEEVRRLRLEIAQLKARG